MLVKSDVQPNEITRMNAVLQSLASSLACTKSEAAKCARRLDNERRGHIKTKTGPTRARQITAIINSEGWTVREFVHRKLPLLKLPEDLADLVKRGLLEPTKALELRKITDLETRKARTFEVIQRRVTVKALRGAAKATIPASLEVDLRHLSRQASRQLAARVVFTNGELRIAYSSPEELTGLLERFGVEL